ncbi:MAG: hypothetical protein HON70_38995 [Lentisphaerae bacterium]|nr:hypothetical protein [Lentisphaerota bacterium]
MIESQISPFVGRYCLYPDVAGAKDAAPYIMPKAGLRLHIMDSREKNEEVFEFYIPRVLKAFQENQIEEGMRWFGALAHYLEDSSCPCHIPFGNTEVPKGAMPLVHLEFFERFMPVPERLEEGNFHTRIDAGGFTLNELKAAMEGYRPILLGTSAAELVFNLGERQYRMNRECVRHLIPMMMALCHDQRKEFGAEGLQAATEGTKLVADTLYSLLMVSFGRATLDMMPAAVSLADYTPASGTGFTWNRLNYQGRIMRNASGSFGDAAVPSKLRNVPLKLKLPDGVVKEFAKGFGAGVVTEYTFLVPPGVFTTFSVDVGSNADIGSEGIAGFSILLDGKSAAETGDMAGGEPAKHLEIVLGQARKLTLKTTGQGKSAKIHAVWANPLLKR